MEEDLEDRYLKLKLTFENLQNKKVLREMNYKHTEVT